VHRNVTVSDPLPPMRTGSELERRLAEALTSDDETALLARRLRIDAMEWFSPYACVSREQYENTYHLMLGRAMIAERQSLSLSG
jgi:hypothetical protein